MVALAVTGTGRSGTRWLSKMLNACGITAGHETAFTPTGLHEPEAVQVDVSWLALTYAHDTPMVAVMRPALPTIRSLLACGVLTNGDVYTQAIRRALGDRWTADPVTNAARWWLRAHTDHRLTRVVSLARLGGPNWWADAFSPWFTLDPEQVEYALHAVGPTDPHALPGSAPDFDLPADEARQIRAVESWHL